MYWRVWMVAACVKVLLWPSYRSTDFDVHRNWLAITHSRPAAEWYADRPAQSEWTLDYPPLFALFERALAPLARRVDPNIVDETQIDYASVACVRFQRATVLATEFVVLGGAVRAATAGTARDAAPFALSAALIAVDHVHFQYNGLVLGLLIFALASLRRGAHVPAAVAFAGLLCLKHLFLTIAPFFGVYLLRAHVAPGPVVQRFLELGLAAGLTAVACVSPLLGPAAAAGRAPAAFRELLGRLFPFGDRGLVHSYWAPNAWALYVFLDRVLAKAAGRGGGGATRGLVETKVEVLPGPGPKACLALTLFAQLPALLALARARDVSSVRKLAYPAAAHTALAAFLFGWHVHEKFLLVAVAPLALLALEGRPLDVFVYRHAARLATFAVLPLLPGGAELGTKILLVIGEEFLLNACFPAAWPAAGPARRVARAAEAAHGLVLFGLFLLKEVVYPCFVPARLAARFEFLPLMLWSVYGAVGVVGLAAASSWRLLGAAARGDAGAWERDAD